MIVSAVIRQSIMLLIEIIQVSKGTNFHYDIVLIISVVLTLSELIYVTVLA